ncbi:MAG: diguanylate cyclase [Candidatus Acidiferrales bacterium]
MPDPFTHGLLSSENPVRLLFLENDSNDIELCMAELKRAGLVATVDVAEAREDFTQKVRANKYDLILADYRLPNWTGTEALLLLNQYGMSIPVIVVTGKLGEENSAECLRLGAADLVLKDHLARLPIAVLRTLREESLRRETHRAKEELAHANEKLLARVGELHRLSDETNLIHEMGDLLQACISTTETCQIIRQFMEKLFPGESGALCMLNASHNLLDAAAVWGEFPPAEGVFAPDDCWALRRGRSHLSEDCPSALRCKHLADSRQPGSLCVPLMALGESLGLLHLRSSATAATGLKQRDPQAHQLRAERTAERIALALVNLKLRESLRWQSIRDPLTGLFNRRYMEESLDREIRRAIRNRQPLGTIMVDLDHFKNFNDAYGHEAGDTVLAAVGGLLQSRTRVEDIACRYGGEEFALIMPDAHLEFLQKRADELREEAKHLQIHYRGKPLDRISLSLGLSSYPEHGNSAIELLRIADAALYRAKSEGRDRVVVADLIESNVGSRLISAGKPLGRHG